MYCKIKQVCIKLVIVYDSQLNVGLMAIYSSYISVYMPFTPSDIQQEEKLNRTDISIFVKNMFNTQPECYI